MLYYAAVFLLIALVSGALGFGVVGGLAAIVCKVLFILFVGLLAAPLVPADKSRA